MPAPTGIRLRDSCHACAASKTKCSKDKPQCTRCQKRGTSCQYLVTQRTGRKSIAGRDGKDDATERPPGSRTTTPESSTILPSLEREPRPELTSLNSRLDALEAAIRPSNAMLLTDLDFSAPVKPYNNAIDSADVSAEYMLGISQTTAHEISYGYNHGSSTAEGCAADQRDLPFSSIQSSLSSQDLAAQDASQATFASATAFALQNEQLFQKLGNSQTHTLSSQQEGTQMALQLMGHLCWPEDSAAYANLSPPERELWVSSLVDRCRKVTETVSDMLQCHNSESGYFLAVVCLVMSKVLDTYLKVSQALNSRGMDDYRVSLSSSLSSSSLSSLSATGSESSRSSAAPPARGGDPKAVQQLLDELFQVRVSMDLLGAKIASIPSKRDWVFGSDLTSSYYDTLKSALPFSAEILNQLYDEQCLRLKTISLQLINTLKAFWVDDQAFHDYMV